MATYGTDFDEFTAGATSTNLTGFTNQLATNTTSTITDLGGGDHVVRHTKTANGLALITYDAFETADEVEALVKITLGTTSDQNAQIGPALIASDNTCYAWRANTTPTATTWRLAFFNASGSVSGSIGTAATFTEPTAGTAFWIMIGRATDGQIYGSLWQDGAGRPGSPMASATPGTVLTTVKPGFTTWDSSDDPMDFHWFGAATEGDAAPETAGGSPIDIAGTVDAMVIAEQAALVQLSKAIAAGADTLVIAELAATVRQSRLIAAGVDALTISELQAAAGLGLALSASVDALVIAEQVAAIGFAQSGRDIAKTFRYPSPLLRM